MQDNELFNVHHDEYDYKKLMMLRDKYRENRAKGIPFDEMFTPEEHLYLMKYLIEYLFRELGSTKQLTYHDVSRIMKIIDGGFV